MNSAEFAAVTEHCLSNWLPNRESFDFPLRVCSNLAKRISVFALHSVMPASNGTSNEIAARPRRLPSTASGYTLQQQIGRGTAASVYRALCIPLQDEVAIKVIDLEWLQAPLDDIWREIQVMAQSSHPNVVPFSTAFVNGADLWIVMPLLTGGSVLDLMHERYPTGLNEPLAVYVLWSLLKAIEYFHSNNQIHRDVKARNVLLDSKGNVMLSDYGMMGWMVEGGWERKQRQTLIGTPCWMAPEVMEQTSGYDYKADIWSLGITAIEIAQGMAPYHNAAPMKVLLMTLQNPPPTIESGNGASFSDEYKNFVATCLQKDPTQRPSSSQLLNHPLFANGVQKPPDLEEILAKLPPIGSRAGAGQKQLVKQLTKTYQVARSGIFEKSSKGQGWDFGDGELSIPDSSTDTLLADDGRGNPSLSSAHIAETSDKRYNIGSQDPDASARASESFLDNLPHSSKGFLNVDAANVNNPTSMSAKTVGLLRRGRFTVSDVGEKVETRLADFLDNRSSTGEISNSSSYASMPAQSNDGSPHGPPNGLSRSRHGSGRMLTGAAASTSAISTMAATASSSNNIKTSASANASISVTAHANNVNGSNSTPIAPASSPANNTATTTKGESSTGQTQPVRKSRFEVYDVDSSDASKPSVAAVVASTVSSSGASTPSQSDSMYTTTKPRSKSRFNVTDIDPATISSVPILTATATQHSSPRRAASTPQQTLAVQSHLSRQGHHSQPSILAQRSIVAQQPINAVRQPANVAHQQAAANSAPTANRTVVQHAVPQHVRASENQMHKLSSEQSPPGPGVVRAPPLSAPVIAPNVQHGIQPGVLPIPASQSFPPYAQPTLQLPHQHLHAPQQAFQTPPAMQSNFAIQALSNVASLHSNILSLLQDNDRVRQENDYLRNMLGTSQTQQQLQNVQLQQMQQQNTQLHQQIQQLQHLQQQQQLIYQQQLLQQQQLQLHQAASPYSHTLSSSVARSAPPQSVNTHRHSLPSPSPPPSSFPNSESRSAPVVQNRSQPLQFYTQAPASKPAAPAQAATRAPPNKQLSGQTLARASVQQPTQTAVATPSTMHQPRPVVQHPAASPVPYVPNGTNAGVAQGRPVVQTVTSGSNAAVPKHPQRPVVHNVVASSAAQASAQQRVVQNSAHRNSAPHPNMALVQTIPSGPVTTVQPQRAVVLSATIPPTTMGGHGRSLSQHSVSGAATSMSAQHMRPVVQLVGGGSSSAMTAQQQRPAVHHVGIPSSAVSSAQHTGLVNAHQVRNAHHSASPVDKT